MKYFELLKIATDKTIEYNKEVAVPKILLEWLLQKDGNTYFDNYQSEASESFTDEYLKLLDKYLLEHIPVQYLTGEAYFYGRRFLVGKDVLIPRPETEYLVNIVLKKLKNNQKVLEIGTGSGVIGITLNLEGKHEVLSTDLSSAALARAYLNMAINHANISFVQSDLFAKIYDHFDIIISNPPYVSYFEPIQEEVKMEPELALYSGLDGLELIFDLMIEAPSYLKEDGLLIIEHGANHRFFISRFAAEYLKGYQVIPLKDLSQKDRYTIIRKRRW